MIFNENTGWEAQMHMAIHHTESNWAAQQALPLVTWLDIGATAIVLAIAGALLGGMFLFVRIASDDSDRYKELKEIVETLFGTPAHLLQQPEGSAGDDSAKSGTAAAAATVSPFSEPCPACGETVTERDSFCPSCGLRLL
ncbi:zinc ribbon domain-containing protein [Paenibacillus alkaliterrae]|uniref:zinc ribbon domain-containing protein n=1 Tax=Paenibacillus alkaliterrae TaxID=320909 RepID=UPI001F3A38D5|nr:zinc ribbon domain-containing protein [Paenibacillus alkaliterrae]MCF2938859.1 zinc ribbon domain-containing protein [Paenibacillus alkaliterrae]